MDTSITAHKTSFLTSQTRLLSTPLQPSHHITTQLLSTNESDDTQHPLLTRKTLDETLTKLNDKLKSHTRLTFSSQATRHVAEQIHNLYWNEVSGHEIAQDEEQDAVAVPRNAVLTDSKVVMGIAETLDEARLDNGHNRRRRSGAEEESVDTEDHAQRFQDLRAQLVSLTQQRDEKRRKLDRYRRLQELLKPFETPMINVQPNLVTRDGEMAEELARLRVLCARVGGRIAEREGTGDNENGGREAVGFDERLAKILNAT